MGDDGADIDAIKRRLEEIREELQRLHARSDLSPADHSALVVALASEMIDLHDAWLSASI